MSTHPSSEQILAFWRWFETVAGDLDREFDNPEILGELDRRVSTLGDLGWELGPGTEAENALVISPEGDPERLATTEKIVSEAPNLPDWEFLPARPIRVPAAEFALQLEDGRDIEVDARNWRYVLFRFPDGTFDVLLETKSLRGLDEESKYQAAILLLDGLLGEAQRLSLIGGVDTVDQMDLDIAEKSNRVADLPDHLATMVDSLSE